jgi:rRNA maturation RNase YbeY
MSYKSKIYFFFDHVKISIPNPVFLKRFIEEIFEKEKKNVDMVNFIFCSDKIILEINRQYLNHNYYTDIITFGLFEKNEAIYADVYISVDRVRENSKKYISTLKIEILRVVFHGTLHLCGYSDKKKAEKKIMKQKEDFYISSYLKQPFFT